MKAIENTYEKQANDFLQDTGAELKITYARTGKYFPDDKEERDIYSVSFTRGSRGFTFEFGQSLNASGKYWRLKNYKNGISNKKVFDSYHEWDMNPNFSEPNAYDILASLTKYEPGTFENFCADYGYDTDSRQAEKTYQAVKQEYQNLAMLFNDTELTKMQEIQ